VARGDARDGAFGRLNGFPDRQRHPSSFDSGAGPRCRSAGLRRCAPANPSRLSTPPRTCRWPRSGRSGFQEARAQVEVVMPTSTFASMARLDLRRLQAHAAEESDRERDPSRARHRIGGRKARGALELFESRRSSGWARIGRPSASPKGYRHEQGQGAQRLDADTESQWRAGHALVVGALVRHMPSRQ
jgi:hypothetical protein